VERSNIGAAIRDFAQAAGQRDLRSFGFDGRAADRDFADMVTGSRPLRFSKKIEIADIPDAAIDEIGLFKSEDTAVPTLLAVGLASYSYHS
jgi:hypothetical protein